VLREGEDVPGTDAQPADNAGLAARRRDHGTEATDSYWKLVFYLLENDTERWLLNARHMKAIPGRKTDVKDAEWIAKLVEHGLVRPSFVQPKLIRQLRNLARYRTGRGG
jgi:hypothetical protein